MIVIVTILTVITIIFFRVAICSVRYNCNKDLANAESRIRDFDMIWLDDFVNRLGLHTRMSSLLNIISLIFKFK